MGIVIPLLICSLLSVWAAETVAFRRPRHRATGWVLAWVSVAWAAGLLIAGRRVDDGYAAHDQMSRLELVLWAGWLAGNAAMVVWGYGGRPNAARRRSPVVPVTPEKIVAKSESAVGRPPGTPI